MSGHSFISVGVAGANPRGSIGIMTHHERKLSTRGDIIAKAIIWLYGSVEKECIAALESDEGVKQLETLLFRRTLT